MAENNARSQANEGGAATIAPPDPVVFVEDHFLPPALARDLLHAARAKAGAAEASTIVGDRPEPGIHLSHPCHGQRGDPVTASPPAPGTIVQRIFGRMCMPRFASASYGGKLAAPGHGHRPHTEGFARQQRSSAWCDKAIGCICHIDEPHVRFSDGELAPRSFTPASSSARSSQGPAGAWSSPRWSGSRFARPRARAGTLQAGAPPPVAGCIARSALATGVPAG